MSPRSSPRRAIVGTAVVAVLAVPLFLDSPSLILRATQVVVFAVAFLGLHLLSGRLGLISIGHGAYMGIGAVAAAHAINDLGVPYLLAPLAAAVVAAAFGALIAVPSLRLPGTYFALLTLSVAMALPILLRRIDGPLGVAVDGDLVPPGWTQLDASRSGAWQYLLVVVGAAVTLAAVQLLVGGAFGRVLIAVRDEPRAAAAFGVPVAATHVVGVMLATGIAGVAGGLRVYATPYVSHQIYGFDLSLAMFALVVAFGAERLWAAAPAAAVLVLLPEALNRLGWPAWEPIIYGAVLLVMTRVGVDGGLGATIDRLRAQRLRSDPQPGRSAARRGPWELG